MSDQNKNKDPFEQFFRKKSGDYDIPYREEDWLKLENQLDLRDANRIYQKRVRWLAAASVLIISLLGYFTYDNYSKIDQLTRQLSEQAQIQMEQAPEINPFPSGEDIQQVQPSGQSIAAAEDEDARLQITGPPPPVRTELPPAADLPPAGHQMASFHTFPEAVSDRKEIAAQPIASHYSLSQEVQYRRPAPETIHDREEALQFTVAEAKQPIISGPEPVATGKSRLSLGLMASPDLTTVNTVSNFHDPGYKFGISVEYRLSDNLSVSTGLQQSLVRYNALSDDYNLPGYPAIDDNPENLIGECLLFDIPVSMKYSFINFERSRFFARTELSSYIMLNEDYYFAGTEGAGRTEVWSGKTGTRHWMSNAGFSLGYELDIQPGWSLRAEPFIKIPLREVGRSNVRLYSMGSFISVNYRL